MSKYYVIYSMYTTSGIRFDDRESYRELYGWTDNIHLVEMYMRHNGNNESVLIEELECNKMDLFSMLIDQTTIGGLCHDSSAYAFRELEMARLKVMNTRNHSRFGLCTERMLKHIIESTQGVDEYYGIGQYMDDITISINVLMHLTKYCRDKDVRAFLIYLLKTNFSKVLKDYFSGDIMNTSIDVLELFIEEGVILEV